MVKSSRRPFTLFSVSRFHALLLAVAGLVVVAASTRGFAQSVSSFAATNKSYRVLSASQSEVVIQVEPQYDYTTVLAADGKTYSAVNFAGGSTMDSAGAPDARRLILPLLAPNRTPVSVEVLDQTLDVRPNFDLAPVPSYIRKNGEFEPFYTVQNERYLAPVSSALYQVEPAMVLRTAYMQRLIVSPVAYDPISRSLTLVRSMRLRVKFSGAPSKTVAVTPSESGFFQTVFVNGSTAEFYRAALSEIAPRPTTGNTRSALSTGSAASGQWLMVETTEEGVYRISAHDLASAGISGSIDPNSIEIFGVGGATLSENVTGQSGDWVECPIELHASGGDFQDIYFYAPGVTQWKYSAEYGLKSDGVYHTVNPYADRGHYLLKVGGDRLAPAARILSGTDTLSGIPQSRTYVLSGITHEVESQLEHVNNWGHELIGEKIPRADVGSLEFSMDAPGYLSDSTTIRVGYDASVVGATGSIALGVNGQGISTLPARTSRPDSDPSVFRNWDNATRIPSTMSSPFTVDLSFTSDGPTAYAKLDFVEMIYRRSLVVGNRQIPFFVVDTLQGNRQPLSYAFQQANGGAVWDVTASSTPVNLASASGDAIAVTVQPRAFRMRKFIVFSEQSLRTPSLAKISAPALRETLGQTGVEEVILTPSAFLGPANELKQIREQGGQATEPLSVAVVNIDSVYREFGYGSHDITAIRDFMAYTFRHGATKVHYLLLLGNGHCDYLNRATSIPNWMPPFEVDPFPGLNNYRTYIPTDEYPYPDDGYFVRLDSARSQDGHYLDAGVGRVSALTVDEAEGFVQKTARYEHGSDSDSWRSITTFQADDRVAAADETDCDGINHLGDSESEEKEVPGRVSIHKIYDVSYPRIQTSSGPKQPDVETAIINAINDGTAMYSFVGHGNPNVWTHEGVMNVPSTLNRFTNLDKLAYFTTATCDFSEFDNYAAAPSGGVRLLLKPDGGAIGLLGTSRSVTGGDALLNGFYATMLGVKPESGLGSGSAGDALIGGKLVCNSFNLPVYYLLGDPAQRLLIPKRLVSFDSMQGATFDSGMYHLPALSQTKISGHILQGNGQSLSVDNQFNGLVTVTLFDAPIQQRASTICPVSGKVYNDAYWVEGPILYRGTATVKNGAFSVSFIVPKDVRLDTLNAKLSGYAFASDGHTALGAEQHLRLMPPPPDAAVGDTNGPSLSLFIGSRAFRNGDAVSKHTTAIVDVSAKHGLNTSTASVGHSFIVWVDDAQDSSFDMAPSYISKQDDYTAGSSERRIELPAGVHTLHARAFDAYNNPSFASVEFVAKNEDPYRLYEVTTHPNPLTDHTTFSFTQPGHTGSLVEITLSIFTTDARLERTITLDTRESTIDIPWDGRDNGGNSVANGVHLFTIVARNLDDGTSTQAAGKCVVAR